MLTKPLNVAPPTIINFPFCGGNGGRNVEVGVDVEVIVDVEVGVDVEVIVDVEVDAEVLVFFSVNGIATPSIIATIRRNPRNINNLTFIFLSILLKLLGYLSVDEHSLNLLCLKNSKMKHLKITAIRYRI